MRNLFFAFAFITCLAGIGNSQTIRDVDFKNFSYEAGYCGEEGTRKITVSDGNFYRETLIDEVPDRMYFSINVEAYGDLDGDGREEAVITSICNTGGTGNFSEAYIYSIRNGVPERVITITGGDRAYGGIREARIVNGRLEIDSSDAGETGGACCPEFVVTNVYELSGKTISEVGKERRRELYPAETVKFDRGKYSSRVYVEFGKDDPIRRFSVSASKGQTLTVTKSSDAPYLRLFKGNADVTEEGGRLIANLREDGEYVFELASHGEDTFDLYITVTIR